MRVPAGWETNLTAAARDGTTLTASGTPHAEAASYTEIITSTAAQVESVQALATGLSAGGSDTSCLLDLATGASSSEVDFLTDWSIGGANNPGGAGGGRSIILPFRAASASRISSRIRALVASETAEISVWLLQTETDLDNVGAWVTYGVDTANSRGTTVPPASGSYGAWTEIGTTSEAHNLLIPSLDLFSDTNVSTNATTLLRLGYGATTGSHANDSAFTTASGTIIDFPWAFYCGSGESVVGPWPTTPIYVVVGSGVILHACLAAGSTEARGVSIHGATGTLVTGGSGGGDGRGMTRGLI